jgi:imidazolonepropionase
MQRPEEIRILVGAAEVLTCTGPARETEQEDPAGRLAGGAVAIEGDEVVAVGDAKTLRQRYPDAAEERLDGGVLAPGWVDSHTHAVFGRWRADEFALRCTGVPYMEIARRGGGILSSVRDLRALSEDDLVERSLPRLAEMLQAGTTTAEVKSGYGLDTESELKTLRAIRRLNGMQPIDLVPTFLGAHEFPPEYRDDRDGYVDVLVKEMIPAVAEEGLAEFCDVFMEPGVYDRAQSERVLRAGMDHGLVPKLHADELEGSGAAELAAEIGAASADHLGAISETGVRALAGSETVATLLPGTLLVLGRKGYAPARALLDAGATVALATDFNPGSSPISSPALITGVACSQMGMSPAEALRAATVGGARALRREGKVGVLAPGARADLVHWGVEGASEIPYRFGAPLVRAVWRAGERVL